MANTNDTEIMYHYGTTDPSDYQVGDVLVCIAAGHGMQEGGLYLAQAVARRKAHDRVITTVTVSADLQVIHVIEAEAFLRRTRVVAEVMSPNGQVKVHSFPDPETLDVWCALTRTPANRVRNKHYVQAEPTLPGHCRFTAMCVPGELDDGSDADWYVYDLLFRMFDKIGAGPSARSLALWTARQANHNLAEIECEEADRSPG